MGFADLAESGYKIVLAAAVVAAAALAAGSATNVRNVTEAEMVFVFVLFVFALVLKHEALLSKPEGKKAGAKKKR